MDIDYQSMIRIVSQIVWPIGRISGLVISAPFFSSNLISSRIKLLFIFMVSWSCSFLVPPELTLSNFNSLYCVYIIQELVVGILMGFILQLVFQIFILSGQIISMQSGLGFAVMVDPASQASVPFVSQYFSMMITLMFLSLNGHIAILDTLFGSFSTMPIGKVLIPNNTVWGIMDFSGWMFKEAVLVSIPAIFSLLVVSLAFGIITRVAPQLNLFSMGFPITLLFAILLIKVCLSSVGNRMIESLELGMSFIVRMLH